MPWQILLIFSVLFLSLNGLFHRSLLKDDDSDPKAQAIIFLSLGGILTVFIALFSGKLNLGFSTSLTANLLAIAVFATIAYVLKYHGFKLISASEVVILGATSKLWNVVGAYFFLHETITLQKILGAIIILVGVAITMYIDKKFRLNKGTLFVLLAGVIWGFVDINGFYILQNMDALNYQIYFYLLPVLALILVSPSTVKKLNYYFRVDRAIKITLLSLFDTLGLLTLFLAYQAGGQASVIGPLSNAKIIVTVILAMVFLKERDHLTNKLIGAIVTALGVVLLL